MIAVNLHTEELCKQIRFRPEELQLENFTLSREGAVEPISEDCLRLYLPGGSVLVLDWEV